MERRASRRFGVRVNGVRLIVPVSFKDSFVGTKRFWSRAEDSAGNVAPDNDTALGFKTEGLVQINAAQPSSPSASVLIRGNNAGNGTTTALSTGVEALFTLTLNDLNGARDLDSGYILINDPYKLDWTNSFTLVYLPRTNHLYLRSTDGSTFIDGGVVGQSSGTLENDAGRVRLAGCSATLVADGVRLVVPITFKSAFAGTKQMWSRAQDMENNIASDENAGPRLQIRGKTEHRAVSQPSRIAHFPIRFLFIKGMEEKSVLSAR